MPGRHRIKQYIEDSFYHIYNRGVEKRLIFLDNQDYAVFLSYLKEYLTPKDELNLQKQLSNPTVSYKQRDKIIKLLNLKNFADEITLISYCLMPNHFHLCIKQKSAGAIDKFMKSLATRYTMYFNKKYKRVGPLYQDIYKAVSIKNDEQLLYLTSYIHKQALASQGPALEANQPSSYPEYLGQRKTGWVHPEEVLAFFSKTNPQLSYQPFVEGEEIDNLSPISTLIIDD